MVEREAHRVALPNAGLFDVDDLPLGMELDLAQDLLACAVGRVALDEDQLGRGPSTGVSATIRSIIPASFFAGTTTETLRSRAARSGGSGACDDPPGQAELADHPDAGQHAVQERGHERDLEREEDAAAARDRLEAVQLQQVRDVLGGHPVAGRRARLQAEELEHRESRAPELAERIDDDPRVAGRAVGGDVAEEPEQIVHVGDEIGEDDVVERLAELEVLAVRPARTRAAGGGSRASSIIRPLTSIPTPRLGSSAASRSPEPQPISSTDAPGRTIARVSAVICRW